MRAGMLQRGQARFSLLGKRNGLTSTLYSPARALDTRLFRVLNSPEASKTLAHSVSRGCVVDYLVADATSDAAEVQQKSKYPVPELHSSAS